jgi:hypothetical protein
MLICFTNADSGEHRPIPASVARPLNSHILFLNVARHTMERFDRFVRIVTGRRITYKSLIAQ